MIVGAAFLVGVVYLVLLVVANVTAGERCNPWNITLADRLLVFPAEIAFATFGWLVMNAPLVAAAMIPLVPIVLFVWLLWEISR